MAQVAEQLTARLGYAADPGIDMLLPKEMLAQIKINKIDMAVKELQSSIEILTMQREMLAKEYKLR